MRCTRCVMPEYDPDITLDEDGLCSFCRAEDRAGGGHGNRLMETDLTRLLGKHRGKRKYDCLVMCSGGKDSTYALYCIKKRYKLEPLAFMFDHGFEAPEAVDNVKRATEILGVDFIQIHSMFMHDFFAEMIRSEVRAPICAICSLWYMDLTYGYAKTFGIPLIVSGWTRGQMDSRAPSDARSGNPLATWSQASAEVMRRVREKYPKYRRFPRTMAEVARRYKKFQVVSPHWFLDEDPEVYSRKIAAELGWRPSPHSYPLGSTNCQLNFISVLISLRAFGFTHYDIESSQLIRQGELSRQEALAALEVDLESEPYRPIIDGVLERLGCRWSDLDR